jgi:hypothetical protein
VPSTLLQRARELLGEGDQGSGGSGIKILLAALSAAPGLQTLLADAVVHRWVAPAWVGISRWLAVGGWVGCVPVCASIGAGAGAACGFSELPCPHARLPCLLIVPRPVQPAGPLDL